MKALVTYYSYSDNTEKIAKMFGKILEAKGEVHIQKLKPAEEITNFLSQCSAARNGLKAPLLQGIKFDVDSYDVILIGSPVWAFAPAPAVNTFLENVSGLAGKRVIIFLASGGSMGVKACFKNMRDKLEAKGALRVDEINIPDGKNKDADFVASSLQRLL